MSNPANARKGFYFVHTAAESQVAEVAADERSATFSEAKNSNFGGRGGLLALLTAEGCNQLSHAAVETMPEVGIFYVSEERRNLAFLKKNGEYDDILFRKLAH